MPKLKISLLSIVLAFAFFNPQVAKVHSKSIGSEDEYRFEEKDYDFTPGAMIERDSTLEPTSKSEKQLPLE